MADTHAHRFDPRLLTGVAWALLLLGLWLWSRDTPEQAAITRGDVAAVGRPAPPGLPPAHRPLPGALPRQLVIEAAGVRAPVVGLGPEDGSANEAADEVVYAGPRPGSAGVAVLVGRTGTASRPAVFRRLSELRPGQQVRVNRADGSVARFTVESVETIRDGRLDPRRVREARVAGRAELRLIGSEGGRGHAPHGAAGPVVVTAYLTGAGSAAPGSTAGSAPAGRRPIGGSFPQPGW